jgi:hypothetical protein
MTNYKDKEKRKLYQKNWLREKAIKKKGNLGKGESDFHITLYKLIALRKMYDLKDHAYWIITSRKVHSELLARFENVKEIVEEVEESNIVDIVEKQEKHRVITTGYFYCEDCKCRLKRTEFNSHHTKCRICYYPNKDRGKCLISLDM